MSSQTPRLKQSIVANRREDFWATHRLEVVSLFLVAVSDMCHILFFWVYSAHQRHPEDMGLSRLLSLLEMDLFVCLAGLGFSIVALNRRTKLGPAVVLAISASSLLWQIAIQV